MNKAINSLAVAVVEVAESDPEETKEWLDSLVSVVQFSGAARAHFILRHLIEEGQKLGIVSNVLSYSAYRNSIPVDTQVASPGDLALEERLGGIIRWNALAMVMRANRAFGDLGGHIASY